MTKDVEIVDPDKVPLSFANVELRPIDLKAVRKLALAGVEIPGVRVVERESEYVR